MPSMPSPFAFIPSPPSVYLVFKSEHGAVAVLVIKCQERFSAVFSIGTIQALADGEQLRVQNLASLNDATAWAIKAAADRGVALELASVHGEF